MNYLAFHDWPEWKEPSPTAHNVYIHDFAMLASHDVPCNVCWENKAIFTRNMTPGRYCESWQPCDLCQSKGWHLVQQRSGWWHRFTKFLKGLSHE